MFVALMEKIAQHAAFIVFSVLTEYSDGSVDFLFYYQTVVGSVHSVQVFCHRYTFGRFS